MNNLNVHLSRLLIFIGSIALLAMMLQVTADVIGRYVFNMPVPLTMELVSYYYMVAVAMLPLAALERKGSNLVHVELVYVRMPARLRRVILPVALALSALYCFSAGYAAWKPAISAFEVGAYAGSSTTTAIWPTRFFPVIGFGVLALVLTMKTIVLVRNLITGRPNPEDEPSTEEAPHG